MRKQPLFRFDEQAPLSAIKPRGGLSLDSGRRASPTRASDLPMDTDDISVMPSPGLAGSARKLLPTQPFFGLEKFANRMSIMKASLIVECTLQVLVCSSVASGVFSLLFKTCRLKLSLPTSPLQQTYTPFLGGLAERLSLTSKHAGLHWEHFRQT